MFIKLTVILVSINLRDVQVFKHSNIASSDTFACHRKYKLICSDGFFSFAINDISNKYESLKMNIRIRKTNNNQIQTMVLNVLPSTTLILKT